jgi:signal transduction histidine kinase/CheY-like chemotaxis protein
VPASSLHQAIVDNGQIATGARLVHFAWYDADSGEVSFGATSGLGAPLVDRALAAVRRRVPSFDERQVRFRPDMNPYLRRVYLQGEPVVGPFEEIAAGAVDPRVLKIAQTVLSLRHTLSHPLRAGGRVVGSVAFHFPRPIDAGQRAVCEAFARQAELTVENAHLAAEREARETELLRAQRLETAGRIAGQVAHDFNNLLAPLVGYPELIKMRLPPDHPVAPLCDALLRAAEQLATINQDLLALGRRGHVNREPADLNQLVRLAWSASLATPAPETLRIELDLADDLLPVSGSSAQLERVVLNLITNAREAMADAGVLRISTGNVYLDSPVSGYSRVGIGEYARVEVSDTGSGIPDEIRDKIFDAFFTTKKQARRGAGLGLSVVQAVVDDHKGFVDVKSEVGASTTFTLYLPISREGTRVEPPGETPRGLERVLIVDDDDVQREVAGELLTTLGYTVEAAASGEAAIEWLRVNHADLLVLDMIMPGGMDGADTFRHARELRPDQRAIVLSGYAESERVREALDQGAGAFVRKPITRDQLGRAVRAALDRAGMGVAPEHA